MAVPDEYSNLSPEELAVAMKEVERQVHDNLVLLDGMLHQAQGLGIPPNVVYTVVDAYLIYMRKRLVAMFGEPVVLELEKGAEDGSKAWFKPLVDVMHEQKPAKHEDVMFR